MSGTHLGTRHRDQAVKTRGLDSESTYQPRRACLRPPRREESVSAVFRGTQPSLFFDLEPSLQSCERGIAADLNHRVCGTLEQLWEMDTANYSAFLFPLCFMIVCAGFVDRGGVCTIAHLWGRAEDNVVGSVLCSQHCVDSRDGLGSPAIYQPLLADPVN